MRSVVFAAVLVVAVTASSPVLGAEPPTDGGASEADFAHSVSFRAKAGFRSDVEFVRQAETDPSYSSESYGVALSADEEAELQRRMDVSLAIEPVLEEYVSKQPEFAGWWIDQLSRGQPVILVTKRQDEITEAIRAAVGPDIDFRVELVGKSWDDLQTQRGQIEDAWRDLEADGVFIDKTGIRTAANAVSVGLLPWSDAAAARIKADFGDDVIVEPSSESHADACSGSTGTLNCRPIKGGLQIVSTGSAHNGCTGGFVVRGALNGGPLSLLTAGHCVANDPINQAWNHNGNRFGDAKNHTWADLSNGDVTIIEIDDSEQPNPANKMWLYNGSTGGTYAITGYATDLAQTAGQPACWYGSFSNNSECDFLNSDDDVTKNSIAWGVTNRIRHTNSVDFDMIPGDSGGPYYQKVNTTDRRALGTHVHSTDGAGAESWYTTYLWGLNAYEAATTDTYHLCVTAACP